MKGEVSWFAIPAAASAAVGRPGRAALHELYERAHRTGYVPREFTDDELVDEWGVPRSQVRKILAALERGGHVAVERSRPGERRPSVLVVHDPVKATKASRAERRRNHTRDNGANNTNQPPGPVRGAPKPEPKPGAKPSRAGRSRAPDLQPEPEPEAQAPPDPPRPPARAGEPHKVPHKVAWLADQAAAALRRAAPPMPTEDELRDEAVERLGMLLDGLDPEIGHSLIDDAVEERRRAYVAAADVEAIAHDYEVGTRALVDHWLALVRPHPRTGRKPFPNAPDGIRRRDIRLGLALAVRTWRAERARDRANPDQLDLVGPGLRVVDGAPGDGVDLGAQLPLVGSTDVCRTARTPELADPPVPAPAPPPGPTETPAAAVGPPAPGSRARARLDEIRRRKVACPTG